MKMFSAYMRSWNRSFSMQVVNLLTLTLSYSLLIFMANGAFNFNRILQSWGEDFKVTVYIKDGELKNKANWEDKLKSQPLIESFRAISREEEVDNIAKSLNETFIKDIDLKEIVPETYELTLKSSLATDGLFTSKLEDLVGWLKLENFIEDVSYGRNWLSNYSELVKYTSEFFLLLTSVLIFSGLYILSHITKSSISNRREEIEVLEIIGASKNHIRLPYIVETAINSLMALSLALLINYCVFSLIQNNLRKNPMFIGLPEQFSFFNVWIIMGLVFVCTMSGVIISFITVRVINNGWSAATRLSN